MERKVGTVSRGIRCPIFREGDDLATIVVDTNHRPHDYQSCALAS